MRAKILIIENERHFPKSVCLKLREYGFAVDVIPYTKYSGSKRLYEPYALVIYLAVRQENADGLERFKRPVLYVLEQGDLPREIDSFRMGAEDYISEPVHFTEVLLRVQMLLRCAGIQMDRRLKLAHLEMDLDARTATANGARVPLTAREFNILYGLLSAPDRTFTRQELMNEYWGDDTKTSRRAVDVYMTKLREKFRDCGDFRIETVHGVGYKAVLK